MGGVDFAIHRWGDVFQVHLAPVAHPVKLHGHVSPQYPRPGVVPLLRPVIYGQYQPLAWCTAYKVCNNNINK